MEVEGVRLSEEESKGDVEALCWRGLEEKGCLTFTFHGLKFLPFFHHIYLHVSYILPILFTTSYQQSLMEGGLGHHTAMPGHEFTTGMQDISI